MLWHNILEIKIHFGAFLFQVEEDGGAWMLIERKRYLEKLIAKRENGLVKVITGLRRCGKSVLLFEIYQNWLIEDGISEDHIIELALDDLAGARYRVCS